MLHKIIALSLKNKFLVLFLTVAVFIFGIYSVLNISIGAVPDITNNQVQVITTSRNLATQDIEKYITYTVELEMANLPGVQEIRSISKFGLSVVTIVFDDKMGTYLPRQLIAEKIKLASEKIPAGFGTPEMGPISTGLGEIFQYTLEVKPEFKNRYSVADLRTIQDWIVKRQLTGISGVVEVNTWGGYLKEYEIAFNPNQLIAMQISIGDLLHAVESNNNIAGGAYIEKSDQSYFIRSEGKVNSLKDIEDIVVKNSKGTPLLIKDIATVKYGHANRFGAITGNGEGEKVLGQIMMLKGSNSNVVIENVKKRIQTIEQSLPEGVYINGFLERSELVKKTTHTVAENLIIGCLIVIFIVVLLLGNWRSGLLVASIIPLCLVMAISLMNIFGMDANLMSLGAIDFGIIIDGAVIIVEFVAFNINKKIVDLTGLNKKDYQKSMDDITLNGASKMMNSAVFAQVIILIVFIPILSLSGIEGKMFKPMALSFSFALLAAMFLCLTYLPVAASLFLKPVKDNPNNISSRLIRFIKSKYTPIITWSLKNPKKVLIAAVSAFVIAVIMMLNMGGEFIPTLDEGDFVIQPVLKTGTSLSKTIEITTEIEKTVLDNFPEVMQVVSRIGAAEIPTDPMSMEESDIIVKLKSKKQWVSTKNKDELADKIKDKLNAVLPNIEIEFTQPIEMRFNELISGTRSDVGIKIYGDDLDILAKKANEMATKIKNVEGASDIVIEKTEGLPQISIIYNRQKLARYNIAVDDLNQLISTAFAGTSVGQVFEGEKKFDVVVRMHDDHRKNIEDVKNLILTSATGQMVPLQELADITNEKGPAKISRDNTNRRIVVGVNVRNRDMQSVVDDIKKIINQNMDFPSGYYVTYGGQFENLQSAKDRLYVVVPISLVLIFLLLYFAFSSFKDALMIFSAIPLAAIGGIAFLWLRGLPFSISAGVGFIALFGVAVLNGIVLIEHFKDLKNKNFPSMNALIIQGTSDRLRAVLLTAAAASLGFLPMAISSSAGAEVQKPLATVVIGGLFTSTLLTLVVLPILFKWADQKTFKFKLKLKKNHLTLLFLSFFLLSHAQNQPQELQDLLKNLKANNLDLKANQKQIEAAKMNEKTSFQLSKTNVYYGFDQNNLTIENIPLHVFGASQDFRLPMVYQAQKTLNQSKTAIEENRLTLKENELAFNVSKLYYNIVYAKHSEKLYQKLNDLYENFAKASNRRYELGDTNYLEKITAESKQKQIKTKLNQTQMAIQSALHALYAYFLDENNVVIENHKIEPLNLDLLNNTVAENYYSAIENYLKADINVQKRENLPDLNVEYFQGDNKGVASSLYGVKFGVAIPLVLSKNKQKVKTKQLELESWQDQKKSLENRKQQYLFQKNQDLLKYQLDINYYNQTGKNLSYEIINVAEKSYKNGEIDFFQFIISVDQAMQIEFDYIHAVWQFNIYQLEKFYLVEL